MHGFQFEGEIQLTVYVHIYCTSWLYIVDMYMLNMRERHDTKKQFFESFMLHINLQ